MQNKPFFSIVIPALNEEKYLPKLLENLSQQSFFKDKYEVIIVDGDSDDKTVSVAKKFQNKIDLEVFTVKKRSVAFQRNFGASKAKGDWILFMDADNRLPDYFLDGIKYQISKNSDVDIFTTWLSQKKHSTQDNAIIQTLNLIIELQKNTNSIIALGALIGIRSKIVEETSFDESQKVAEDSIFVKNAIKKGFVFKIFRKPKYVYSLRRLKKEGLIKMVRTTAQMNLRYLQGKDFKSSDFGYKMKGGKYYDKENKTQLVKVMRNFQELLKTASKKQIQQMKRILLYITEV